MKKVGIVLGVLLVGLIGFVATRPGEYRVERSQQIAAPADVAFDQVDVLKCWSSWSPWEKMDPGMDKTYSGPDHGVGASYEWSSSKAGKGKMTIVESSPGKEVALDLHFIAPFENDARADFTFAPTAEGTNVTWAMTGHNNFVGKFFGLFMNMDDMLGKDFESGLSSLGAVAEAAAKKKAEEQAAAQVAAAQAAAQAAAAPAAAGQAGAQPAAEPDEK
jgi:hypothetical protein